MQFPAQLVMKFGSNYKTAVAMVVFLFLGCFGLILPLVIAGCLGVGIYYFTVLLVFAVISFIAAFLITCGTGAGGVVLTMDSVSDKLTIARHPFSVYSGCRDVKYLKMSLASISSIETRLTSVQSGVPTYRIEIITRTGGLVALASGGIAVIFPSFERIRAWFEYHMRTRHPELPVLRAPYSMGAYNAAPVVQQQMLYPPGTLFMMGPDGRPVPMPMGVAPFAPAPLAASSGVPAMPAAGPTYAPAPPAAPSAPLKEPSDTTPLKASVDGPGL